MTHDEENLARSFCAGEEGSFDALYRQFGERIYRFCRRLCENSSDAEDLAQEVFLAAFRGQMAFKGNSSLTTWLYRIAVYRHNAIRRPTRLVTVALEDVHADHCTGLSHENQINLENAIFNLPHKLRDAFVLVRIEGFTCKEASKILQIPESTLKSRVHTGITILQRILVHEDPVVKQIRVQAAMGSKESYDEL